MRSRILKQLRGTCFYCGGLLISRPRDHTFAIRTRNQCLLLSRFERPLCKHRTPSQPTSMTRPLQHARPNFSLACFVHQVFAYTTPRPPRIETIIVCTLFGPTFCTAMHIERCGIVSACMSLRPPTTSFDLIVIHDSHWLSVQISEWFDRCRTISCLVYVVR